MLTICTGTLGANSGVASRPGCCAINCCKGCTCSGVMPIRKTLGIPGGAVWMISETSEYWTRYTVSVNITPKPSATRIARA